MTCIKMYYNHHSVAIGEGKCDSFYIISPGDRQLKLDESNYSYYFFEKQEENSKEGVKKLTQLSMAVIDKDNGKIRIKYRRYISKKSENKAPNYCLESGIVENISGNDYDIRIYLKE